jgi:uncharacterized protein (TIGR02996 family)
MSFEVPTPDEQPFVDGILDDLDDDGPRLVYADWLAEQGDPRGEFIHVQCRLAALPMDDSGYPALEVRERELLAKHRGRWTKALPKLKHATWGAYSGFWRGRRHFRRGLVEHVTFSKPLGFTANEAIFERTPARSVTFLEMSRKLAETLPESPYVERLRGLSLPIRHNDEAPWPELPPERIAGLEELAVQENSLGSDGLDRLLETLRHARLRALDVGFNGLGAVDLDRLAAWEGFEGLRTLRIGLNDGLGEAVARLVATDRAANLHELDVWNTDLTAEHAVAIAKSKHLGRLVQLDVSWNGDVGDEGTSAIARSTNLRNLRRIHAHDNDLTDATAIAFAESESSSTLDELDLQDNRIGNEGFIAIAESPHLANLRRLHLARQEGPSITKTALRAFGESPYLRNIEFLNLGGADFDDATLGALKKRFRKAFTDDPYKDTW